MRLAVTLIALVAVLFIAALVTGPADIGPFGAEGYETATLNRMAEGGRIFTDFYVTQAVCSASPLTMQHCSKRHTEQSALKEASTPLQSQPT